MSYPLGTFRGMDDVNAVAERQHGVVTLAQVTALGLSEPTVLYRLRTGRWEVMADGVYRVGGSRRTWEQAVMALTLAAGPDAAASHRSAAALLGIPGFRRRGAPEATTPRPRRHRRTDALVHRSRVLPAEHLTEIDGIPTTRVARTLIDLAGVLHPARVERAVDSCLARGAVTLDALAANTAQLATRGRTGITLMRALLEARGAGYVAPESELEARFLDLVRAAALPEPRRQVATGDEQGVIGRVDFAYPGARLFVELDGRRHHSALLDREADRTRDNRLVVGGWRVMRLNWDDVTRRADRVASALRHVLTPSGDANRQLFAVGVPRTVGGGEGLDPLPGAVDLGGEVGGGAVVGDHQVGAGEALGAGGLGGHAPADVGLVHTSASDQAADSDVLGTVDHHHGVGVVPTHLHEQGDDGDDDLIGVLQLGQKPVP